MKALHFNSREDFAVEWLPEETPDDDRFLYEGDSTPPGNGSFLIPVEALGLIPEESLDDTAEDITPDEI